MTGWGILGAGRIARQFCDALAGTPAARIAAIGARDAGKARRFADAVGAAQAHGSYAMLCADPAVDVVYIATPNHLHAEHAILAMRAGKAVLIEKPLATTEEEARRIADVAAETGRFCMEALWTRFVPAVVEADRLIREGRIGQVRAVQGDLSFARQPEAGGRFYDPALGGGALLDLGVYPLSLAVRWLGPPMSVSASGILAPGGAETDVALAVTFATGIASLRCGFSVEGANEMTIIGDEGRIRLHRPLNAPVAFTLTRHKPDLRPSGEADLAAILAAPAPPPGTREGWRKALRLIDLRKVKLVTRPHRGNGMGHQADEVMRCLAQGLRESPVMPLADSMATIAALEQAVAQLRQAAIRPTPSA
jgi:predicted dehydrogenase